MWPSHNFHFAVFGRCGLIQIKKSIYIHINNIIPYMYVGTASLGKGRLCVVYKKVFETDTTMSYLQTCMHSYIKLTHTIP